MSRSTCSNSKPRVSMRSSASAQNMNASSGSGLWPRRISIEAAEGSRCRSAAPEEPALQRPEDLAAPERRLANGRAVALGDADVVLECLVCRIQRILELVAFEDVVVGARLVARAVLRV